MEPAKPMTDTPDPDYRAGWSNIRQRAISLVACLVIGVPLLFVRPLIFGDNTGVVIAAWGLIFCICMVRFDYSPCPRCKQPFRKPNAWSVDYFNKVCPHCGIRKGSKDGM